MVRMAEVAPTDIRVKEMRCCLRLGMAIFPISALFLLLATWPVLHEGDEAANESHGFKRKRKARNFYGKTICVSREINDTTLDCDLGEFHVLYSSYISISGYQLWYLPLMN